MATEIRKEPWRVSQVLNEYMDSCAAEIKEKVSHDSQEYEFDNDIKPMNDFLNSFLNPVTFR